MNPISLGDLVTHCTHCGVRFRPAERALHSCEGEIKMRDVEIVRLRGLLARMHEAAALVVADARDQGRDDCMDDLVDEQFIETLRNALRTTAAIPKSTETP